MFQTFVWNRLAASHFVDREAPFVSFFQDDNGVAIVPAAVAEGRIVLLGERLFDYRDVLLAGDVSALAEAWRPVADLRLPLSVTAVRGDLAERWSFTTPLPFCGAPRIKPCEMSAEGLEASHRKLGRFSRRLRRHGLSLRTHGGDCSDLLRWIYAQKARQFHGESDNIFADGWRAEFIVSAAAAQPLLCEIFTYEHGSSTVAALVTFRDESVRRFYTVWFDSAWAKESPGQVLVYEAALDSLRNGIECDFMTGEQPHKMRLATSSTPLYCIDVAGHELRDAVERLSWPTVKVA